MSQKPLIEEIRPSAPIQWLRAATDQVCRVPGLGSALAKVLPECRLRRRISEQASLAAFERMVRKGDPLPPNLPRTARLNLTGLCNLRCKFCEIHYIEAHARAHCGKVHSNPIGLEYFERWDAWLRDLNWLAFEAGAGEPLVNPECGTILSYLRNRYPDLHTRLVTNGWGLTAEVRMLLLKARPEYIICSLHAGNAERYRETQGSGFDDVVAKIAALVQERNLRRQVRPKIALTACMHQGNADSLLDLIRLADSIAVDEVHLNQYYHSRNQLKNDISFFFRPEEGNRILREVYALAADLGVCMHPATPKWLPETDLSPTESAEDCSVCALPWKAIQFPSCLYREGFHFAGVCNRIDLFCVDMRLMEAEGGFSMQDLWHHPILQYLRHTVNSRSRNPICRFCKTPNLLRLRSKDPAEYSRQRDAAVRGFLEEARMAIGPLPEIRGVEVLDRNPFEYDPEFFAFSGLPVGVSDNPA